MPDDDAVRHVQSEIDIFDKNQHVNIWRILVAIGKNPEPGTYCIHNPDGRRFTFKFEK